MNNNLTTSGIGKVPNNRSIRERTNGKAMDSNGAWVIANALWSSRPLGSVVKCLFQCHGIVCNLDYNIFGAIRKVFYGFSYIGLFYAYSNYFSFVHSVFIVFHFFWNFVGFCVAFQIVWWGGMGDVYHYGPNWVSTRWICVIWSFWPLSFHFIHKM